jgi:hypothetical protein
MEAWLADAVILGSCWVLGQFLIFGEGLGWAILGGVFFGATMASLAVWRRWPTIGRRRFAKPA